GRRDAAQQLPEELHVYVVQRPAHGEVVQFVRGKGFQFVTCHPWTLSHAVDLAAPVRGRRPCPARASGTPSAGLIYPMRASDSTTTTGTSATMSPVSSSSRARLAPVT